MPLPFTTAASSMTLALSSFFSSHRPVCCPWPLKVLWSWRGLAPRGVAHNLRLSLIAAVALCFHRIRHTAAVTQVIEPGSFEGPATATSAFGLTFGIFS